MAIANSDGSIVLTTRVVTDGVEQAIKKIKTKFASLKDEKNSLVAITEAIKLQKEQLKRLNDEYTKRVVSGQAGTDALKKEIKEETATLKELEATAATLGKKSTKSFDDMSKGLKNFGKRISGIVKSALIFSLLYKVMQSVVKLFQNILMSDEEFRQDWEELKAAFYTAAYPIVNLIVPAIKYIVQQVRDWAVSIGKVAAALQGVSYSELVDQAKASKEAADNYADMEKSSKKTADNVKKQFASFDDIQILSSGNEEEQGTGQYAGFEGLGKYDTSGEKSVLDDLMTAIGGALAAVGLILLFKGQIGWGIGFLVAGAAFWAIGEIWGEDYDTNSASDVLNNIMQTIGVSLAAIGIILITKGIIPWGIGFLVAGAAVWAITEFAEGEFSTDPIVNTLVKILGIAGTALLALGIILCVFGVINPISIGLIVAGAASLVAALGLSQDAIVEAIRGPLGVIMAIVGAALLVLGIILVCTGVGIPLGIGLILAGAAGLATVVAVNWDAIVETVKNTVNAVLDWIKTYGLLVLGILLCLTGVGIPFGIALLVKWAKDGAENGVPIATAIVDKVKEIWASIKAFWDKNIAPIFTAKFWLDLAKNCANGLIGGFENAINGIITMFENMINFVVDGINSIGFDIPDWLGGGHFGFNIPRVEFDRVSIPRLAQGTVVPPNKEFMAVLGDNTKEHEIVSPISTMKQAFMEAMIEMGGNFGGGNTEVVLEIDGREFGRAVVEQGNRENRRIGTRLVIV